MTQSVNPGEQDASIAPPDGSPMSMDRAGVHPARPTTSIGSGEGADHGDHEAHHEHLLRDAESVDDWAWRRAIRARRPLLLVYRGVVLTLGFSLIVVGLILVPLPGPGWLVVFLGLAILASEFEPANRLLHYARGRLHLWNLWIKRQSRPVQALVALVTFAFVCGVVWVTLRVSGVPSWLPDVAEDALVNVVGLPRA